MKRTLCLLFLSMLWLPCLLSAQESTPPKFTASLRPLSQAERKAFLLARNYINTQVATVEAGHHIAGYHYTPITPENEPTWMAEPFYVLDAGKFMQDPVPGNLMKCARIPSDTVSLVGKEKEGRYIKVMAFEYAADPLIEPLLNYANTLMWVENILKMLGFERYAILHVQGNDYYVFELEGQTFVFRPQGEAPVNAEFFSIIEKAYRK